MFLKKKIAAFSAILTAAVLAAGGAAYAKGIELEVLPKAAQYDELSGKLSINALPNADIYVKIIKHTPETNEEGYVVYDTTIAASDVSDDCRSVMKLEGNNYNIENQDYDGFYDILIGVHKHIGSDDPEDILYKDIYFIVTDKDVSGYDTLCDINVSLSDKDMDQPNMTEQSDGFEMKYDIVFPHIEIPAEPTEPEPEPTEPEPEPTEPAAVWGDANKDGTVNIRDAALIASKLAGGKSDELPEAADYNKDGSVNIRDAAALAKALANKKV